MSELETLKKQIETVGEEIKTLKTNGGDKETITKKVAELLAVKKAYADANNGIGVDGKPYEQPLSKAEKKKKAKAEKAAAAAAAVSSDDQTSQQGPNADKAAKKAAKKAAAKAKKEAYKKGDVAPPAEAPVAQKKSKVDKKKKAPVQHSQQALKSFELMFNPNAPLATRFSPVIALSTAVLCNTAPDLTLTSNHKRQECFMGTPSGVVLSGDIAIARYIARTISSGTDLLGGDDEESQGLVDMWLNYSSEMRASSVEATQEELRKSRIDAISKTLDETLSNQNSTYVVHDYLTIADVAIFAVLGFSSSVIDDINVKYSSAIRWVKQMSSSSALLEAQQLALSIGRHTIPDANSILEPLEEGMNALEGALPGRVVTRFPPEPSGYLHIGHAKAVLLNDYYARRYKGKLILRLDDTNPSKEKEEFQQAIIDDLKTLGVYPDKVTHTSDYFGAIEEYARQLIKDGLAFMDDTPQEKMQAERLARENSVHRNQSVQESLCLFDLMCSGKPEGANWCLRAKIDMQSVNGTLRDPVLYRQNLTPHHNTGITFKAYATYDLACPIVDSLEGVTHALRTTEYNDRDEQYAWLQRALGLRRVRIHAFARLNFINTELSKRKLAWFVDNNVVSGWDDARFPTVRGITRRGLNVTALRKFIYSQGASRRIVTMEWTKFWAENKKYIDDSAKRFMAIAADKSEHCVLTIANYSSVLDASRPQYVTAAVHPKKLDMGKRVMKLSSKVILESIDVQGVEVGEDIALMKWGVIKITKVEPGHLHGELVMNGSIKSTKRKVTWMAIDDDKSLKQTTFTKSIVTEFDNLISKEKLEEGEDFKDFVNPNTLAKSEVIGDAGLKNLNKNEVIQLERRGYFRVDRPYISDTKPLILFMIPDGKAKAMGGLSGKLAHR